MKRLETQLDDALETDERYWKQMANVAIGTHVFSTLKLQQERPGIELGVFLMKGAFRESRMMILNY